MKPLKLIGIVIFLFSTTVKIYAVEPPSNLEVKIKYEVSSSNFNPMNPLAGIDQTGDAEVSLIVQLKNTNVQSIEVVLKRSALGDVLISKSFEFGSSGTLADGTTYHSKDNVVELGLGTFNNMTAYFAEVKVTDTSGNISSPITKVK